MPNKKTSQRKKAAKQKLRQKDIRSGNENLELGELACNLKMECDKCGRSQKSRSYCYFCGAVPRLPVCGECGKWKCLARAGDCLVGHPAGAASGLAMVGAICDFCEAFLCHARRCLATHACACPLREAVCLECHRGVTEQGGRVFRCGFCRGYLCEDDQFQHQASCQVLESDSWKCQSCNRLGQYSCLRCKTCHCEEHVRRKGFRYERNQLPPPCPKCGFETASTKDLSMSIRTHGFGQRTAMYESLAKGNDIGELVSDEEEELETEFSPSNL